MSSGYQQGPTEFVPLAVTKTSFLGLVWGSLWVAFLFLLFRGYVRINVFGRLFADDFMVLLAWTLLLVNAAIWQDMVDYLYLLYAVDAGEIPPPANIFSVVFKFIHRLFAVSIFNLCSLWAVKTSFLIFFFKLGHNVQGHKPVWWGAVVACIIGFIISIGVMDYQCSTGSAAELIARCDSPAQEVLIRRSRRLQTACDIITDGFILAIPFKILWKVRIKPRDKIVLLMLFSLTVFTMVVAIIRVTLSLRKAKRDGSWMYMWGAAEPAVAIIIASAISYRSLFHKDHPQNKSSGQTITRPLRYRASSIQKSHGNDNSIKGSKESSASSLGEEVIPLDSIHVRHEYAVIPEPMRVTSINGGLA